MNFLRKFIKIRCLFILIIAKYNHIEGRLLELRTVLVSLLKKLDKRYKRQSKLMYFYRINYNF